MRISEAYEHEPILPYQAEDSCPVGGCNKTGTQCVDIAAPFTLTPTAAVGAVSITCQGSPSITCVSDACGSSCTVTMTQQVCVSVPIRYGVSLTTGEPTITCADNNGWGGGWCCVRRPAPQLFFFCMRRLGEPHCRLFCFSRHYLHEPGKKVEKDLKGWGKNDILIEIC